MLKTEESGCVKLKNTTLDFPEGTVLHYVSYGNTGYGEFKRGTKNQNGFVPNMIIRKKSYLEKWISMD